VTTVTFTIYEPSELPEPRPARGYLTFEPTKSRTSGTSVTLPLPFTVALVNGEASVDIAPTGDGWSWGITYRLLGVVHETHYYLVPDEEDPVPHTLLVEVDPDTLEPGAEPDPGWYSYVQMLIEGQVGVVPVVTGNEARLPMSAVFWVGGSTQPVNMAENTDIWFKAAT
jgi:hypothetical protein